MLPTRIILAKTTKSAIEPTTGPHDDVLMAITEVCSALLKLVELERSGIRHGEGFWVAGDPIIRQTQRLVGLLEQHRSYTGQ